MSVLATALSGAMRTSAHDLVVFDKASDAWTRRPWSQVHARAEGIATRILDKPQSGEPGQRRLRPLLRVGAANRAGQNRQAPAGQPGGVDGRNEVSGRLADQADGTSLWLVEDPRGDAFSAGVNLGPGSPRPRVGCLIEDHQVVS